ncbi:MBL fold metallo-hydrolase [Rufibacter latericius]|uniref:MBL fold metallo-hydrolase n=1 Tax=Rufibacter latericius TaxID=2487040 RepID=A0A3M9N1H4_9BACT|nr:MBL fold metallo-hydrolase [Rufibacter latericius]RNI31245.1 MBL fold metallo-hydrolase [Rufibacter latericius]
MQAHILELKYTYSAKEEILYPVILQSGFHLILVDCGYPGSLPLLKTAVKQAGFSLEELTGVLITHHDIDHMGSLHELKQKYPAFRVYSSEKEAAYISGRKKSARLQQAEDLHFTLPEAQQANSLAFQQFLKTVKPEEVNVTFHGEEEPELFSGAQIINTPGHTPGHFSVYLHASQTLVSGDALVVEEDGELGIANPQYTLDLAKAVSSVKRLADLQIAQLICYHGGVVQENIPQKLQKLISQQNV